MNLPAIAICNFIPDTADLRKMATRNGFSGVDWTFKLEDLPRNQIEESTLQRDISVLSGLEVRYHCAFKGVDLGDEDDRERARLGVHRVLNESSRIRVARGDCSGERSPKDLIILQSLLRV